MSVLECRAYAIGKYNIDDRYNNQWLKAAYILHIYTPISLTPDDPNR